MLTRAITNSNNNNNNNNNIAGPRSWLLDGLFLMVVTCSCQ